MFLCIISLLHFIIPHCWPIFLRHGDEIWWVQIYIWVVKPDKIIPSSKTTRQKQLLRKVMTNLDKMRISDDGEWVSQENKNVWPSKLSAYKHITHNTFAAMPVLMLTFSLLTCSLKELNETDVWTCKLHSVTGNFNVTRDIDRLYFPCKDSGHGLKSAVKKRDQ